MLLYSIMTSRRRSIEEDAFHKRQRVDDISIVIPTVVADTPDTNTSDPITETEVSPMMQQVQPVTPVVGDRLLASPFASLDTTLEDLISATSNMRIFDAAKAKDVKTINKFMNKHGNPSTSILATLITSFAENNDQTNLIKTLNIFPRKSFMSYIGYFEGALISSFVNQNTIMSKQFIRILSRQLSTVESTVGEPTFMSSFNLSVQSALNKLAGQKDVKKISWLLHTFMKYGISASAMASVARKGVSIGCVEILDVVMNCCITPVDTLSPTLYSVRPGVKCNKITAILDAVLTSAVLTQQRAIVDKIISYSKNIIHKGSLVTISLEGKSDALSFAQDLDINMARKIHALMVVTDNKLMQSTSSFKLDNCD